MCQANNNNTGRTSRIVRRRVGILRTESNDASIVGDQSHKPRIRRNVSFDTTEIRSYPRVMDKSQEGPALSIGWKPVDTEVTTVQERYFERCTASRGEIRPLRVEQRIDVLLEAGYSKKEIIRHLTGEKAIQKAIEASSSSSYSKSQSKPKTVTHKLRKMASKMTTFNAAA